MRARLGLFAPHDTQQHTHTAGANGTSDGESDGDQNGGSSVPHEEAAAAAVDGIMAHHQWIAFMWEVRTAGAGNRLLQRLGRR